MRGSIRPKGGGGGGKITQDAIFFTEKVEHAAAAKVVCTAR